MLCVGMVSGEIQHMSHDNAGKIGHKSIKASRRTYLSGMAGLAGTSLAGCLGSDESGEPTDGDPLTVEFFGGIFKEVLDEVLVEPFVEETSIPVESEAGLTQEELTRLNQAVEAGEAPVDLFVAQPRARIRGHDMGLWHTFEPDMIPSYSDVIPELVAETDDGLLYAVGAFGVYESLVSNMDMLDEPLDSWHDLWDDQYENQLAVSGSFNSHLLDVAAHIFDEFDGQETLETEDGIVAVLERIKEIQPQITMWFDGEAEAQEGMDTNDVAGAKFFNDVGVVMEERDSEKYVNVAPKEGMIENHATWVVPASSRFAEAAAEFIEYSLDPAVQGRITENLYTAPVLTEDALEISDDLYQAVHGPGPDEAIRPHYDMYIEREEFVDNQWRDIVLP